MSHILSIAPSRIILAHSPSRFLLKPQPFPSPPPPSHSRDARTSMSTASDLLRSRALPLLLHLRAGPLCGTPLPSASSAATPGNQFFPSSSRSKSTLTAAAGGPAAAAAAATPRPEAAPGAGEGGREAPSAPAAAAAAAASRVRGGIPSSSNRNASSSSSSSSSSAATQPSRLIKIPGIGSRNAAKLNASGIHTADELLRRYRDLSTNPDAMSRVLSEIGIRKAYGARIVEWLEHQNSLMIPRGVTFSVEGNIGAGKSTFLELLRNLRNDSTSAIDSLGEHQMVELQNLVEVVPEPVEEWVNIPGHMAGQNYNILDEYYKDPTRWAYTFQNYVFITRFMQEKRSRNTPKEFRILERSVFSDRMVFVRQVHETTKNMSDLELSVYDSWFNPFIAQNPTLVPDGFIYLRAGPDTCMERMKVRDRREEVGVGLNYLEGLHEKHEDWFMKQPSYLDHVSQLVDATGKPIGTATRLERHLEGTLLTRIRPASRYETLETLIQEQIFPKIPDSLKGKIVMLDQEHASKVLHGIPALVLNYDKDTDVLKDPMARQEVSNTVNTYLQWTREYQKAVRSLAAVGKLPKNDPFAAQQSLRLQKEEFDRFMSLGGGASHGHDRSDSMEALQRSLREVFVKSAS